MMATLLLLGILPITAFAAVTGGNGEGTLVEGLLGYSYQWELRGNGQLSTRLNVNGPDDECKGSVTAVPSNSGGTITMTAHSSVTYTTEDDCGSSVTYEASAMSLEVTVTNLSNSPIKLTKLENTNPSAGATVKEGDILESQSSFTVNITAEPGQDTGISVQTTNQLTIEAEILSEVVLTAFPSEYVGYTVTAGDTELSVEKNGNAAQTAELVLGTTVQVELNSDIPEG